MAEAFRPEVSPSLLSWARESSHVKVEDLAAVCDVKPSDIESWEQGIGGPTLEQLRQIATKTRRSLTTFFLPEPPEESAVPQQFRTLGSKAVARLSMTTMLAIRGAQESQEQAIELIQLLGERRRAKIPSITLDTDITAAAEQIRKALAITLTTQFNWKAEGDAYKAWRGAIEDLGILTLQSSFPLEDGRGFCLADDYAPVIAINSNDCIVGRIFSLLHELIHLCLGISGLSPLMPLSNRSDKHDRELELFCNRVAAQTLLPVSNDAVKLALRRCVTDGEIDEKAVKEVAGSYKVSRAVVVRSLATLKTITSKAAYSYERATTRPGRRKKGGRASLPYQLCVIRKGLRLPTLVLEAFDRDRITMADASGLLGLKVRWFEDLRGQLEA